jgi:hypothetical protein
MSVRDETPELDLARLDGPGRLDDATAERLLAGAGGDGGHDILAAVLALTTAPARPAELTGEHAALTAFRAARPSTAARGDIRPAVATGDRRAVPAEARRVRRGGVSRLLTAKVGAVAALAVLGGSGLTLAASTGHLPGQRPVPAPVSGTSVRPVGSTGPAGSTSGRPARSGLPGAPGVPRGTGPAGTPAGDPRGQAPAGGQPARQPSRAPSAAPSPKPTNWFPTVWPSWLPKPSDSPPTGRTSPTGGVPPPRH